VELIWPATYYGVVLFWLVTYSHCFADLASCLLWGCFTDLASHLLWGCFCCVSVANKDCTCLVTTYNQLRKLWENKDKQNQMSHNPSHHNGAGPCSLHSGEGALHASMFGSNSSLGWLLPLFCFLLFPCRLSNFAQC